MKKFILLSIVLLSLLVAPLSDVFAQARLINYQGNILNQEGQPLMGPVQITFELYSAEFGGTQLWSEIQNVDMNKGYFNVYLGSETPFPANFDFNRDLWLQVTVGKGSPYQRTLLSMVPYSGYSDRAAVAGFAEDIEDGSVTLAKLNEEVINMGGDLMGQLPNPTLRPGAVLENIPDGSITQEKLNPNVTVRPSGPASGDLTGFYPDPLIAPGAVKTDRLADGAVTGDKIADFSVAYDKLQNAEGPFGTILGWDGTKWVETSVAALEVDGVIGNEVLDATATRGLVRAGGGTEANPYTLGIADDGVQTAMIQDGAVTLDKYADGTTNGQFAWWNAVNGTWNYTGGVAPADDQVLRWVDNGITREPVWSNDDAMIGNEITDVVVGGGLERIGAGTEVDPFLVGIAEQGVTGDMLADGAVALSKLAPGTQIGQVIWWDAAANQWRHSTGAAPLQDQVIKWVDAGGTLTPQWAQDDMTIPFEKTITEHAVPLFSLTNNGNSDVMSLTSTGTGDGLNITLTDDIPNGGHALHVTGGGMEQPAVYVERTSGYGLPDGAMAIEATINSLDAESAGLHLHLTVNDDGNNKYDVEGIQSFLNINGGVADTYYTSNWSVAESDNGIATGVWGDAYAANAQTNLGVVGSAFGAATANVGVFGAANDFDYEGYTLGLPAGFGAGVVAYNNNGSFSDYGLFAQAPGNATGVYSSAAEGSAYIGINESTVEPTIFAYNMEAGPSLIALSDVPSGSTSASIENFGGGRGAHIWGGAANDKDGGNPYLLDPMDQDDAALVVYNLESMMGAPWATAIKTYGDIWANSAIGASQIIGLDRVVVGDPINGPFIELLPPAAPGDPLVIEGDVLINGDLEVDKVVADEIEVTDLIGENGVFENLTVNIEANINTANIATANIAEVNAMVANLDEANVMVANIDEANITTANITDAMVDHADVALAHIEEAVIETSIELGMNTELIADMSGIQGAGNAGDLLVSKGAGLNPEWTNTLPALNIFDLNVLNNANIGNDLLVGGNSEVVGSALVGADLEVMGNGLVNLDFAVLGNIRGANITTTDAAAVNSFAGNVEMANTLTVNGNANFANPVNINNTLTVANTLFADGQLAHMAIEVDETNVNWSNAALGGRYSFYVYIGNGALQVNTNPELPNTGTIMYIANEGTGNLTLDLDGDTVYETLITPGEVMQFISTGYEIRRVL